MSSNGVEMKGDSFGLVHVYTGNGKGKTTAAIGQAIRALGHGCHVMMVQFMKGRIYGELIAAQKLRNFKIIQSGTDKFVYRNDLKKEDIALAKKGFHAVKRAILSGKYDIIILDEINVALDYGLLRTQDVVRLLKNRPKGVEIILTGRNAPKEILALADLVTEMKEVRHYYKKGIPARKGIEW